MRLILLMCLTSSFLHSAPTKKRKCSLLSSLFKRKAPKEDLFPHLTAAWNGDEKALKKVYKTRGTDLKKDKYGNHTILAAASHSENNILRMALENEKDRLNDLGGSYTPLQWSCLIHNNEGVKMLLEAEASTEIKGSEKQTALHIACNGRNVEAISLLLDHGANIEAEDMHGNISLIYAMDKKLAQNIISRLQVKPPSSQ